MYRTDDLQELWVGLSCFLYQAEFFFFICVDKLGKSYIYSIGKKCLIKSCVKKTTLEKNSHNVLYCEKNNFLMSTVLNENIYNCDFRNSKYIGNDEDEFYKTIYSNGGLIKKEYEPKPIPFEYNDEN